MTALYAVAGFLHLVTPAPFLAIIPDWVPAPHAIIALTGLCEIAGAWALLNQRLRYWAGTMLALYAVYFLLTLGGIEESVFLEIGGEQIKAAPTEYDDRTTPDGKTSSVHWLRFKLNQDQIARFAKERVVIGIGHRNYGHMAVLGDETSAALAKDFG